MFFFEDLEIGRKVTLREYVVDESEVIAFATQWDPQPFHVDKREAEESVYKGLTACGCHIMAIRTWLLHHGQEGVSDTQRDKLAIIGALGWDELRFPNPVRPGDRLSLTRECIEKRESRTKPDRGIVQQLMTLRNQNEEVVLVHKDTIMVAKRPR
jgi:acyl dehydratase